MLPILAPAGVQELIDYMLTGWALSRFSGCWVGIKSMKDTVEATAVVDGDPHRLEIAEPADFVMPPDGLNIRLNDTPQLQEARLHDYKRFAAQAFARRPLPQLDLPLLRTAHSKRARFNPDQILGRNVKRWTCWRRPRRRQPHAEANHRRNG